MGDTFGGVSQARCACEGRGQHIKNDTAKSKITAKVQTGQEYVASTIGSFCLRFIVVQDRGVSVMKQFVAAVDHYFIDLPDEVAIFKVRQKYEPKAPRETYCFDDVKRGGLGHEKDTCGRGKSTQKRKYTYTGQKNSRRRQSKRSCGRGAILGRAEYQRV